MITGTEIQKNKKSLERGGDNQKRDHRVYMRGERHAIWYAICGGDVQYVYIIWVMVCYMMLCEGIDMLYGSHMGELVCYMV